MKVSLTDICDFQGGTQPPKDEWIDQPAQGYVRMLQIRDFTQSDKNYIEYVKDTGKLKTCIEDDILIGRYGASIGKILTGLAGAYNVAIVKTIPDEKVVSKKYLYWYLNSQYFQRFISNVGSRAAQAGFNKNDLGAAQIPLVDKERQEEICEVLEKANKLISLRKQQLAKLDELIKARFVEMFGDPINNPMKWIVSKIEDIAAQEKNALKAGPFGSALKKEFYVRSGYKIYGQEQVICGDASFGDYYIDEEKYKELKNCAVQAGDILISLVGTYGKTLIMPDNYEAGIINPRLMKITLNKNKVTPIYFKYYFESNALKASMDANTHGGTMGILNLGIIRQMKIQVPPLSLQNQFAVFVERVDQQKQTVQQSLEKLELMKKALMQEYFG